ncbi:biopolymer transporter ExbD [Shewanella mangrovi]|uniref:Tol-Pal system protein TolR n=1 Tax=Shewanella mangrovi TaxID=1515746 RepID=A0A094JY23_9GAMM|nr:protein TolR [Shewanella mangrovi]KFZ37326.1 biopolymer transporter ExbD [Shewanella mangrovi]
MNQGYQRKRRRPVAEINVVPYIDVMLVLLIIFMVTAPIVSQGVKVDLPQASAEPLSADSKPPIIVSIDADGAYYVTDGASPIKAATDVQDATAQVVAFLNVEPDRPVVVKGDRAIPYEKVIQLMATLKKAGLPSVGLMTDSPEDN